MSGSTRQPRVRLTSSAYKVGGPSGHMAAAPRVASVAVGAPPGCTRAPESAYFESKELCEAWFAREASSTTVLTSAGESVVA